MKHFIIFISSFFLLIVQINAKEKTDQTQSIEALIKQIKNSSSDDRRAAMNKLKIELRTMNTETRKNVMLDLQNSFAKNNAVKQGAHNKPGRIKGSQQFMKRQRQGQGTPMQQHTPASAPMRSMPGSRQGQPGGHR